MEGVKKNPKSILSRENLFKYARNIGVVSYGGLGIAISQPGLLRSHNLDLTNSLLLGSFLGTSAFIYERKHLQNIATKRRLVISVYGSGLFNLGSLLIWAIVKAATQDYNFHPIFRGFLSLAASYYMVKTGLDWVQIVDQE